MDGLALLLRFLNDLRERQVRLAAAKHRDGSVSMAATMTNALTEVHSFEDDVAWSGFRGTNGRTQGLRSRRSASHRPSGSARAERTSITRLLALSTLISKQAQP